MLPELSRPAVLHVTVPTTPPAVVVTTPIQFVPAQAGTAVAVQLLKNTPLVGNRPLAAPLSPRPTKNRAKLPEAVKLGFTLAVNTGKLLAAVNPAAVPPTDKLDRYSRVAAVFEAVRLDVAEIRSNPYIGLGILPPQAVAVFEEQASLLLVLAATPKTLLRASSPLPAVQPAPMLFP